MHQAYNQQPVKLYFMGSSEGGREALTMAQRYPDDFDGIFARVPVINWTALNHASAQRRLVTMGDGWLSPAHVKLVHDAALPACDADDGVADELIANPSPASRRKIFRNLRARRAKPGDLPEREADRGRQVAALADQVVVHARQRRDRISGLGHFGRGHAGVRSDRRLDGVVDGQRGARAAAETR